MDSKLNDARTLKGTDIQPYCELPETVWARTRRLRPRRRSMKGELSKMPKLPMTRFSRQALVFLLLLALVSPFVPPQPSLPPCRCPNNRPFTRGHKLIPSLNPTQLIQSSSRTYHGAVTRKTTELASFLGSDGGILGVGGECRSTWYVSGQGLIHIGEDCKGKEWVMCGIN